MCDEKLQADAFEKCSETGNYFRKIKFPFICSCCNRVYSSRKDYLLRTFALEKGDYTKGPNGTILEYRNCACGTTLAVILQERRDDSSVGLNAREEFYKRVSNLVDKGISITEARAMLLQEKNDRKKAA